MTILTDWKVNGTISILLINSSVYGIRIKAFELFQMVNQMGMNRSINVYTVLKITHTVHTGDLTGNLLKGQSQTIIEKPAVL